MTEWAQHRNGKPTIGVPYVGTLPQSERSNQCARLFSRSSKAILLVALSIQFAQAGTSLYFYYAHPPKWISTASFSPWYKGQNGQYDFRVRIAAETVKRYPWATADRAVVPAPEYLYNGTWAIDYEGRITVPPEENWANGDLGQRAAVVLSALINYYRYSGDASVRSHITAIADSVEKR